MVDTHTLSPARVISLAGHSRTRTGSRTAGASASSSSEVSVPLASDCRTLFQQAPLVDFESESVRIELIDYVLRFEAHLTQLRALGFDVQSLNVRAATVLTEVESYNKAFPKLDGRTACHYHIPRDVVERFAELERRAMVIANELEFGAKRALAWHDTCEKLAELELMSSPRRLFTSKAKGQLVKNRWIIAFAADPARHIQRFERLLCRAHETIKAGRFGDAESFLAELAVVNDLHEAARFGFLEFLEVIEGGKSKATVAPEAGSD